MDNMPLWLQIAITFSTLILSAVISWITAGFRVKSDRRTSALQKRSSTHDELGMIVQQVLEELQESEKTGERARQSFFSEQEGTLTDNHSLRQAALIGLSAYMEHHSSALILAAKYGTLPDNGTQTLSDVVVYASVGYKNSLISSDKFYAEAQAILRTTLKMLQRLLDYHREEAIRSLEGKTATVFGFGQNSNAKDALRILTGETEDGKHVSTSKVSI